MLCWQTGQSSKVCLRNQVWCIEGLISWWSIGKLGTGVSAEQQLGRWEESSAAPKHRLRHTNKKKQMGEYKRHQGSEQIPETHRIPPWIKPNFKTWLVFWCQRLVPVSNMLVVVCRVKQSRVVVTLNCNRKCALGLRQPQVHPPVMTDPEEASEEDNWWWWCWSGR